MKNKCKIIAEIGWNHMGNMKLAKKMILAAKQSGADFAKFQTWSTKTLLSGPNQAGIRCPHQSCRETHQG